MAPQTFILTVHGGAAGPDPHFENQGLWCVRTKELRKQLIPSSFGVSVSLLWQTLGSGNRKSWWPWASISTGDMEWPRGQGTGCPARRGWDYVEDTISDLDVDPLLAPNGVQQCRPEAWLCEVAGRTSQAEGTACTKAPCIQNQPGWWEQRGLRWAGREEPW